MECDKANSEKVTHKSLTGVGWGGAGWGSGGYQHAQLEYWLFKGGPLRVRDPKLIPSLHYFPIVF